MVVVNGCPLGKSYYRCLVSIALERSLRPIKTSDKPLGALSLWAAVYFLR